MGAALDEDGDGTGIDFAHGQRAEGPVGCVILADVEGIDPYIIVSFGDMLEWIDREEKGYHTQGVR